MAIPTHVQGWGPEEGVRGGTEGREGGDMKMENMRII